MKKNQEIISNQELETTFETPNDTKLAENKISQEIPNFYGIRLEIRIVDDIKYCEISNFFPIHSEHYDSLRKLIKSKIIPSKKIEGNTYYELEEIKELAEKILIEIMRKPESKKVFQARIKKERKNVEPKKRKEKQKEIEFKKSQNRIEFEEREITPINIKQSDKKDYETDENGGIIDFCCIRDFFNDTYNMKLLHTRISGQSHFFKIGFRTYYDSKYILPIAKEIVATRTVSEETLDLGDKQIKVVILANNEKYVHLGEFYKAKSKQREELDNKIKKKSIRGLTSIKSSRIYPLDKVLEIYNQIESDEKLQT
jgi:hypothetical protein